MILQVKSWLQILKAVICDFATKANDDELESSIRLLYPFEPLSNESSESVSNAFIHH